MMIPLWAFNHMKMFWIFNFDANMKILINRALKILELITFEKKNLRINNRLWGPGKCSLQHSASDICGDESSKPREAFSGFAAIAHRKTLSHF